MNVFSGEVILYPPNKGLSFGEEDVMSRRYTGSKQNSLFSLWKGREYRRGNLQHLTAKSVLKNCFTVFSEIKENKLVVSQKAYVEKLRLLDAVFRDASTVPILQGI